MVKKFTEIVETKLSSQERKNLIKIIVVLTNVFSMGLAFGEIFLKGHSKDENIPTIFACEEFSGIPFEINGVETKNAQAILENINSEENKENYNYFIKSTDAINDNSEFFEISKIKFLDPCCGSGHILVYAFDIFYQLYLEREYEKRNN